MGNKEKYICPDCGGIESLRGKRSAKYLRALRRDEEFARELEESIGHEHMCAYCMEHMLDRLSSKGVDSMGIDSREK